MTAKQEQNQRSMIFNGTRRDVAIVLSIAMLLRVIAAVVLQWQLDHRWDREFLIEGDANGYWELAQKLARGEDYIVHGRSVLRMPGLPALLAISIKLFGESLFAARIMLAAIGSAACGLVYLLGRDLYNHRTGLIASAAAGILPAFVGFSVTILTETTFACTMLLSLWAGVCLLNTFKESACFRAILWRSLGTGIAIGLAVYFRPSWILAAPILATMLVIYFRSKHAVLSGVIVTASMVLVLLPWGLRNLEVSGHFTLTTLWMGPSLYDGLNPDATGDSNMEFFERDNLPSKMNEYEVDQHYRKLAFDFARQNPGRTAKLGAAKLWRFWKPWPNAEQFSSWPARIAVVIFFIPMIVLAVRGGWECRGEFWSLAILVGPVLYFSALHLLFVGSLRYRLPAEYPLLVLSAVGWETWTKKQTTKGATQHS